MTTKFNRILFDYDGTLIIHGLEDQGKQFSRILGLAEEQIPEFERRLRIFFENPDIRKYYTCKKMTYGLYFSILESVVRPFEDFGITVSQLIDAINEKSRTGAKLASNAIETLEYLRNKDYQLCIFTNGFLRPQVAGMKNYGIHEYFDRIYAWDNFYAKPDKRALKRALAGTEPSCNIMIGDDVIADIAPAKEYGLYTIGINLRNQEKCKCVPDIVIKDLIELKDIL